MTMELVAWHPHGTPDIWWVLAQFLERSSVRRRPSRISWTRRKVDIDFSARALVGRHVPFNPLGNTCMRRMPPGESARVGQVRAFSIHHAVKPVSSKTDLVRVSSDASVPWTRWSGASSLPHQLSLIQMSDSAENRTSVWRQRSGEALEER
nr:hypothetical protein CFP56_32265 [Quercus suber]